VLKAEERIYSSSKPGFYRIYRTEQATDAMRRAESDRIRGVVFNASGPTLSRLFDGSERLISVTSVSWYARQVFVPGS
jgi:hypothetical protein